jgi:hypothetical protein
MIGRNGPNVIDARKVLPMGLMLHPPTILQMPGAADAGHYALARSLKDTNYRMECGRQVRNLSIDVERHKVGPWKQLVVQEPVYRSFQPYPRGGLLNAPDGPLGMRLLMRAEALFPNGSLQKYIISEFKHTSGWSQEAVFFSARAGISWKIGSRIFSSAFHFWTSDEYAFSMFQRRPTKADERVRLDGKLVRSKRSPDGKYGNFEWSPGAQRLIEGALELVRNKAPEMLPLITG